MYLDPSVLPQTGGSGGFVLCKGGSVGERQGEYRVGEGIVGFGRFVELY